MFDDNNDEDEQVIPTLATKVQTAAEHLPIAGRVEIGMETGKHFTGGIVPFPAHLNGTNVVGALTGDERKKVYGFTGRGYRPTVHEYRDAEGRLLRCVVRFDHATERKVLLPLRYCGKGHEGQDVFWFTDVPGTKPLYGLDLLQQRGSEPVLVVEGEKTADAARQRFPGIVVVTWAGGANAVRRVDLTALAGRSVIVWPDNDPAGRHAARLFAARCITEAGSTGVAIVDVPPEFPEKWDLADDIPAKLPAGYDLQRLLGTARPMTATDAEALLRSPERKAAARRLLGYKPGYSRVDPDDAANALGMLDPDMAGVDWKRIARCWYYAFGADGLPAFEAWSAAGQKYRAGEPAALWVRYAQEESFRGLPLSWLLRRAVRAGEEKQRNDAVSLEAIVTAEIEALNENHAVVVRGSKTVVLRETFDPRFDRYSVEYIRKGDFVDKHVRSIQLPGAGDKPGKTMPLGKLWFSQIQRREYDGIVFMPGGNAGSRVLNLWRGFTVNPTELFDRWSLLKTHLFDHVAQANTEAYEYILNWLAHGVQRLSYRNGTALVLTGPKGAGKSILTELYGNLFGPHKFVTSISEDIVGKFNAHLEQTLVLGVEEAFAPQNRAADGTLKDLITRETLRLEDKFFSTWTGRNHLRIIMTSNNDHVVRADGSDRRYAVFEVVNPHQRDPDARRAYFGAMVEQMETGGYSAMLGELLTRDISSWNPEVIPDTAALRKQKLLNLASDPVQSWLHERLVDGVFIVPGEGALGTPYRWDESASVIVPVAAVNEEFVAYCRRNGYRGTERMLALKLSSFMPDGFKSRVARSTAANGTATRRVYDFPSLATARESFTEATGIASWVEAGGG